MEVSKQEIALLIRVCSGPIGQGLTLKEAAKDLGIKQRTAERILANFKTKFPDAWKKFKNLRNLAKDDRYKLRWKTHPDQEVGISLFSEIIGNTKPINDYDDCNDIDDCMDIKEKF